MTFEDWLQSPDLFGLMAAYMKDREAEDLQAHIVGRYREHFTPEKIVTVSISAGDPRQDWSPDPFPGSVEARLKRCICPPEQPEQKGSFKFHTDCPVHELVKGTVQ